MPYRRSNFTRLPNYHHTQIKVINQGGLELLSELRVLAIGARFTSSLGVIPMDSGPWTGQGDLRVGTVSGPVRANKELYLVCNSVRIPTMSA